jgi:hypothetical protein
MDNTPDSENIFFLLNDENEPIKSELEIQHLLDEFNLDINNNNSYETSSNFNLTNNFKMLEECNVSDLFKICDYYGLTKYVKMAKYKKNEIIHSILLFENDEQNIEIVQKRYKMWDYITELNKDKNMKKYIIWK